MKQNQYIQEIEDMKNKAKVQTRDLQQTQHDITSLYNKTTTKPQSNPP
jgi:hypothetical protein